MFYTSRVTSSGRVYTIGGQRGIHAAFFTRGGQKRVVSHTARHRLRHKGIGDRRVSRELRRPRSLGHQHR